LRRPTELWIGRNIPEIESQSENDNLKHWIAKDALPFQGWEVLSPAFSLARFLPLQVFSAKGFN
jgi:hypothetical protein